jgi:hypothetical protein
MKNILVKNDLNEARKKQDNIDYDSGVPNKMFRYNLARMDTPPEKAGYLTKTVGQEGIDWGIDRAGRYYLTESGLSNLNGKKTYLPEGIDGVAIDESKPFTGADWCGIWCLCTADNRRCWYGYAFFWIRIYTRSYCIRHW